MSSQREVILAHLKTVLDGVGGATAYRSREAPATRAEGPVLVIVPEEESVQRLGSGPGLVLRSLTVVLRVVTRGAVPDQVADPVLVAAHAVMMADNTLGGRAALVQEESTRFDFEIADQTALASELRYEIRYHTLAASLTAQA